MDTALIWLDNINIMGDTPTDVSHKVSIFRDRCHIVNAEINEAKSDDTPKQVLIPWVFVLIWHIKNSAFRQNLRQKLAI